MQAAAAQESPYKDQGEYDVSSAAMKEADPQKKLDKLKEWEQKYPDSKLKGTRTLLQVQALIGIALQAYGKTGPPELLDASQKAGQQVADNFDTYLADSVKPAQATDQQWADVKHQFALQVHSALGWDAMAKKQDAAAEAEFKKILQIDPNQAQVSYWLGQVIYRQHNPARFSEAFYDFARALSVTGQTALPPAAQSSGGDFLKKAFNGYHGSDDGLDQLKAAVVSSALPPADFHIDSVAEIETKKFGDQEAYNKAHPDIALWRLVRDTLKGDQGDTYFQSVKGSQVPPPEVGMFKAKIVTVDAKDLVVNVDNAGGDATLKFDKALNQKVINVGDAIEFKGIVDSFAKDPYMLTLTIDDPKEDIKGLPDNAFSAAPAKKAAPKKAAPKKAAQ
jgi:tetratricopeptide (TPR) repeat protein